MTVFVVINDFFLQKLFTLCALRYKTSPLILYVNICL